MTGLIETNWQHEKVVVKKKKTTQGDVFNFSSPATYLSLPDRKQLSFCWNMRSSFDTFAKAQPASRERQRMG